MPRLRPDLLRGLAVFGVFLVLVVVVSYLQPYSIVQDGYTVVDVRRIQENPIPLEGHEISSSATVITVTDNGSFYAARIEDGIVLIFPLGTDYPRNANRILFRGTSWVSTNGSILVSEFYPLDYNVSLIRSAPGIILFIAMFLAVFKIDFNRLAFVKRRD